MTHDAFARLQPQPLPRGWRAGLLIAALAAHGPLAAAIVTWNAGTADWHTASHWLPAVVPGSGDTALVNNGGTAQAAAGSNITVQSFGFGRATTAGASASGTVQVAGNLTASLGNGAVGSLFNGDGSFASGVLTVGGHLTGLGAVGQAFTPGFGTPAPSSATGSVTVQGDLMLDGQFQVGRALGGGSVATGTVTLPTGAIRTLASVNPAFWEIGVGSGASGTGTVTAAAVDTTSQALVLLSLGVASDGGSAVGGLSLGSGALDIAGDAFIGVALGQGGTSAQGTLALGGPLRAQGDNRSLQVGSAGGLFETGASHGTGSVVAQGLEGFRVVTIGTAGAINGGLDAANGQRLVTATGSATVGAGGIVNTTATPGTLTIGHARGVLGNVPTTGPGADVAGAATVAGHVSGYGLVDIGRVEVTGRAQGSLAIHNGTLDTGALRIGSVQGAGGTATVIDGAAEAVGRLTVTDGAVITAANGFTPIGSIVGFGSAVPSGARGELDLTRSSFFGGVVSLGSGGGEGHLRALDNSRVDLLSLSVASGGTGALQLVDSRLDVRLDPVQGFGGSVAVSSGGGHGTIDATRSLLNLVGSLSIVSASGGGQPTLGRVALTDSALGVAQSVSVGAFDPNSRAELALRNSSATVGGDLRLGQAANGGQLFGEAVLELQSSLLAIGGHLAMDPLAAPGLQTVFGIGGLGRGLGGYGAIDTATAFLAGSLIVDFADLATGPDFTGAVFDLIAALGDLSGDFDTVQFVNLAPGLFVSAYGIVVQGAGMGEVWRLTLSQAVVALPSSLALVGAGLLGLALARARRRR